MKQLCNSPFWDLEVTWNTDTPDFTECFQNTALVWVPFAILCIFLPYEIHCIARSKNKGCIRWNIHNICNLILTSLILILTIASLILHISYIELGFSPAEWLRFAILTVEYLACILLIQLRRKNGLQTSAMMFFFWLLHTIAEAVQYRSIIIKLFDEMNESVLLMKMVINVAKFPLVVSTFMLNFTADEIPPRLFAESKLKKINAKHKSSFISRVSFWWIVELLMVGFKRPLEKSDLWDLDENETAEHIYSELENTLYEGKTYKAKDMKSLMKRKSLFRGLFTMYGPTFIFIIILSLVASVLIVLGPMVQNLIITFVSTDQPLWRGLLYSITLFLISSVEAIMIEPCIYATFYIGMKVKSALISALYRKSLRLSNSSKKKWTTGEIVNLMSVDTQRIMETVSLFIIIPYGIICGLAAAYLLIDLVGVSAIAGFGVMVLVIPFQIIISKMYKRLQVILMDLKDYRTKQTTDILNGIKVLKLYAWEKPFEDEVLSTRSQEIKSVRKTKFLDVSFIFVFMMSPFVISFVTFATFAYSDASNRFTPNIAFVSISLINLLKMSLTEVPFFIGSVIQSYVSVKRINDFMACQELNLSSVQHNPANKYSITVEKASFSWDDESTDNSLNDINLNVEEGSLVAVVGQVGAGKSSLLTAIIGDMHKVKGNVNVRGRMAYVPQLAWIQNQTVKQNIIFYEPFDEDKYKNILKQCCLEQDLNILPGGDLTEIGEKGINMSGGQKQRISIARAVYYDADVYLMDDPLSAVDAHVGTDLFENVIGPKGLLKEKTRILVTHGLKFLPECDHIVVIKDGRISETGTYQDLLRRGGEFSVILSQYVEENRPNPLSSAEKDVDELQIKNVKQRIRSETTQSETHSFVRTTSELTFHRLLSSAQEDNPIDVHRIIEEETVETGTISRKVYLDYMRYIGIICSICAIMSYGIFNGLDLAANEWLSVWSQDSNSKNDTTVNKLLDFRIGVYGALGLCQAIFVGIGGILFAIGTTRAAEKSHNDTTLARELEKLVLLLWRTFCTVLIICITLPIFILVVIPLAFIYCLFMVVYLRSSRQLMRLESVSRSPIYNHFAETINGSSSIRAFNVQDIFIKESNKRVDDNMQSYSLYIVNNRWLAICLQIIGALIVLFSSLFAVLLRDSMDSGQVGLVITYALNMTFTLYMIIRGYGLVESNVVSVERIVQYSNISSEADWYTDTKTNENWPKEGNVKFVDYKARYRSELDFVIRGLTADIKPSEKIGIVGRTGAGKSSLTLALFRIIESSRGKIIIDGIDISTLGLHQLRSKLTIIPQDPVLFTGSLRINIDPFNEHSDEEIWVSLAHANLKSLVVSLPDGLHHKIYEGGNNLSVGQRQLICLARAILRKSKIIVLDEATAAIDMETDDLIQQTIRKEFKDCTILTIAHRLNTVMDSDRIMVLSDGKLAEFDKPSALLNDFESLFYKMVSDTGIPIVNDKNISTAK
ncbi:ABCC2 (predicted) [Pycnogonum litorale]